MATFLNNDFVCPKGKRSWNKRKKDTNMTLAGKSITNSDRLHIVLAKNGEK
jgi:hypothetical protein